MKGNSLSDRGRSNAAHFLFGSLTSYAACMYALLVLRLWLGVTFFAHGSQKLFGWFGGPGPGGVVDMMPKLGPAFAAMPHFWAVLVIIGEFGGGVLVFFGVLPRIGAAMIAIDMVVALATVHRAQGFMTTFGQQGIIAICVAIIIAGGGAWCLIPAKRR